MIVFFQSTLSGRAELMRPVRRHHVPVPCDTTCRASGLTLGVNARPRGTDTARTQLARDTASRRQCVRSAVAVAVSLMVCCASDVGSLPTSRVPHRPLERKRGDDAHHVGAHTVVVSADRIGVRERRRYGIGHGNAHRRPEVERALAVVIADAVGCRLAPSMKIASTETQRDGLRLRVRCASSCRSGD